MDETIERFCFLAKIEEGLRQSRGGQVTSRDELKKRFLA